MLSIVQMINSAGRGRKPRGLIWGLHLDTVDIYLWNYTNKKEQLPVKRTVHVFFIIVCYTFDARSAHDISKTSDNVEVRTVSASAWCEAQTPAEQYCPQEIKEWSKCPEAKSISVTNKCELNWFLPSIVFIMNSDFEMLSWADSSTCCGSLWISTVSVTDKHEFFNKD